MDTRQSADTTQLNRSTQSTHAPKSKEEASGVSEGKEEKGVSFDELLQQVIKDSSKIDNLTADEIIELRKKISPYGRTINGDKKLCCMSVVNVSQEYMKRWMMTGLVGFLFRGVDEYNVSEDEPVVNLDDLTPAQRKQMLATLYRDAIPARAELAKLMAEDEATKQRELETYKQEHKSEIDMEEAEANLKASVNKALMTDARVATGGESKDTSADGGVDGSGEPKETWKDRAIDKQAAALREEQMRTLEKIITRAENMTKRFVIREYLDTLFTFNPDVHVRGSYGYNPLDPERKEIRTTNAKKSNKSWKKKDKFDRKKKEKQVVYEDMGDEFDGDESVTRKSVTRHIPPADTYHKLRMYMDVNHDQLKAAVRDIYHEKADIEWAINPYGVFDTEEAAKKFVHKHADEVLWNIETLNTNNWNLLGAFAKNRERTDFLNNNTEVITEYLNQVERDKKLGRQLMMKKATRKKLESVGKQGPDSKMFRRYKKEFSNTAEAMGAVDLSDYSRQKKAYEEYQKKKEVERLRLANARRAPNGAIIADTTDLAVRSGINTTQERKIDLPDAGLSAACPDDAIQVDVISMSQGGLTVQKSNFFTEAEPLANGMTEADK